MVLDTDFNPIPEVMITIPTKDYISTTDLSGLAIFPSFMDELGKKDSVVVSALGYSQIKVAATDLQKLPLVVLEPKRVALKEVEVVEKGKRLKVREAGNSRFSRKLYMDWYAKDPDPKQKHFQLGKVLSFNSDTVLLQDLFFHVHSSVVDSARVEIAGYRVAKNGLPLEKGLFEWEIKSAIKTGWNKISLREKLLFTPGKILISIRYVPAVHKVPLFNLSGSFFNAGDSYKKTTEKDSWQKVYGNLSLYCTAVLL